MTSLGIDLSTPFNADIASLDVTAAMLETSERMALAQACARRLITPRGTLIGDRNYGYDLRQFLNDDIDRAMLAQMQTFVNAELLKDERVLSVDTLITLVPSTMGGTLFVNVSITDGQGPFKLVLSIGEITVQLMLVG